MTTDNPQSQTFAEAPRLPEEPQAADENGAWMAYAIQAITTLLIVAAALSAYHFAYVVPNKQRFAVVDLADVLAVKELQVTIASLSPGNTEMSGGAAFDEISRFAKDIEVAIGKIQQECACTLLVKAAVVRPSSEDDMTTLLKQRLGIAELSQAQLVEQLRKLGGEGKPPILEGAKR